MFGRRPKTFGTLIREYRNRLRLGQADLAREIGRLVKGSSYNSSYVSKWENNQDISEPHFLALMEFFKSRLGDLFNEREFRAAYQAYSEGKDSPDNSDESITDADAMDVIDSAERVLRGEPGIDQEFESGERDGGGTSDMGDRDPFSSLDRRSTGAVKRTVMMIAGAVVVILLVIAVLWIGRGLLDFAAGQMAEQDIRREATRQAFATVTKQAYELDMRLTSEALGAKSEQERQNAEATVVAINALGTTEAAILQATIAAEALIATREKGTAVAFAQSTSEAFETAVAANRTATAMVRIMTAEANTPTPIPTMTPLPTPTPTWTRQPTYTPVNTPLPTRTPTFTPQPTQTPYPTATPTDTPIPTPTPTKTPVPNTEPGTALPYGETWYEDEMAMDFEILRFNATELYGDFSITNLSDNDIFINWNCTSDSASFIVLYCDDNKWSRTEDDCRLETVLEPNQTKSAYSYASDWTFFLLGKYGQCDYLTIEVHNFSRIDKAMWLIDVPN